MNIYKVITAAAVGFTLTFTAVSAGTVTLASTVSACPSEAKPNSEKDCKHRHAEFEKDPVQALENKKTRIRSLLKEGKITKEKAQEMTAKLDAKITEIRSFNKLTLKQKKEKLTDDCRSSLDKLVKEGKLDRSEADTIFRKYSEKITGWDGSGYPRFHSKQPGGTDEKSGKEGR